VVDDEHFELGTTHEPRTEPQGQIGLGRLGLPMGSEFHAFFPVSDSRSDYWKAQFLVRVGGSKVFSRQVSPDRRIYTASELRHC